MDKNSRNDEKEYKELDESQGINMPPTTAKERIVTIVVLAILLITIWFILDIAIVTFILTFVFYHLHKYAMRGLAKTPVKLPSGIVLLLIYLIVLGLFVLFTVHNAPIIMRQISEIAGALSRFDLEKVVADIDPNFEWLASNIDLGTYLGRAADAIMGGLASFGTAALNFLLSLLFSFLFILERHKIGAIGETIKTSRIAFIYRYLLLFASSFCYTFGKVMKVQVVIAAINCAISMVYLTISGFPNIMVLGIMIFILGLIPVAGVFISLVPLCIIAFNLGGAIKIVEVLIMIAIIHSIEAYFLNPKLMSYRTSLPVSIVFVVLIISQRYLGAWGLLIGVPIFIYILNVLNIDYLKAMAAEAKEKTAVKKRKNPFSKLRKKKQE